MAKLINIIKDGDGDLEKRQLPLVIDEKLTMVLDLIDVDFMCEYPKIRGKEKELFLRKFSMLNVQELKEAFQVSCKRLLDIVSEIVPCVGCRRSVERLFHQMKTGPGRSALYPLVVTPEGVLILPEEVYKWPNVIGAMFLNHMTKLNSLSTSWSRSKKSSRCALHSLDAQRYVRPPLGSGWRALWDCMVPFCKQEVATIDISQLLSTLETYLQKHRFCMECRTKVMKAYSLLVEDPDERKSESTSDTPSPCEKSSASVSAGDNCGNEIIKEKGFIPSLYAGIKRCSPNNHIHVDQRTDYIMGLILAAEPELLGNRRERHAKTLEIAQEEVLVCVGLCLYERVHRIQLRLREEQTTCQLLALVAINALSTNFQLAVEMKQGISQLELLFQEFNREDRLKQRRKQVKKLKKRRKKEKKNAIVALNTLEDEDATFLDDDEDEVAENILTKLSAKKDLCYCLKYEEFDDNNKGRKRTKTKTPAILTETRSRFAENGKIPSSIYKETKDCSTSIKNAKRQENTKLPNICRPVNNFSDTSSNSSSSSLYSKYNDDKDKKNNSGSNSCNKSTTDGNIIINSVNESASSCDCCNSTQADCGYGSADNNNISSNNGSGDSSVDSSEVACSEGFCNHDGLEECNIEIRSVGDNNKEIAKKTHTNCDSNKNSIIILNSTSRSLQQMLTETIVEKEHNNDHKISDYIIPVEEIQRYKSCMGHIIEKRKQLRQTLKSKFAQLCSQQEPGTFSTF